jgi:hypothetical protein
MSSLQELMAFAEHQDRVNQPWLGTAEKGVNGFMAGMDMRQKANKSQLDSRLKQLDIQGKEQELEGGAENRAALDRALKMLEIQEKMQKMRADATETRIKTNMAKGVGLLPIDDSEKNVLTGLFFQGINPKGNSPKTNTEMGKMMQMDEESGFIHLPEYSDGKLSIKPHKKVSEGDKYLKELRVKKAEQDEQEEVMKAATQAAQQHEYQRLTYGMSPEEIQGNAFNVNATKVTPDMVQKYFPAIKAFRAGDMKTYTKLMGTVESEIMLPLIDKDLEEEDYGNEFWLNASQKKKKVELEAMKEKYGGKKPAPPPARGKGGNKDYQSAVLNWKKGRK